MLIALPISEHDASLLPNFAKVFAKFGGAPEAEILIVSHVKNSELVEQYKFSVQDLFAKVNTHVFSEEGPDVWPKCGNHYFARTAIHVEQFFSKHKAFYYMELDTLPLKKNWYEALCTEYITHGKLFMGVKSPVYYMHPDGESVVIDGEHMAGSGVYPVNISRYADKVLYDTSDNWAVHARVEIVREMHSCVTLQHNWRTCNYRIGYGSIICDDVPNKLKGITCNKPVRPDAYLLHGCKDDSLATLLLNSDTVKSKTSKK